MIWDFHRSDVSNAAHQAVFDRGLHYGHGVFETLLVHDGCCLFLEAHLDRLALGCNSLGIVLPDTFKSDLKQYLHTLDACVIKLLVTAGVGDRGYAQLESLHPHIYRLVHPVPAGCYLNRGSTAPDELSAIGCEIRLAYQSKFAGIKHLNRLEWVLAANEVQAAGVQEGFLFDNQENLIEATSSNLFLVDEAGVLLTPCIKQVGVAGVVRQFLLDQQAVHSIPIKVAQVSLAQLEQAREVFVCNSVMGIRAITAYKDTHFNAYWSVGPVTQGLHQFLHAQWHAV